MLVKHLELNLWAASTSSSEALGVKNFVIISPPPFAIVRCAAPIAMVVLAYHNVAFPRRVSIHGRAIRSDPQRVSSPRWTAHDRFGSTVRPQCPSPAILITVADVWKRPLLPRAGTELIGQNGEQWSQTDLPLAQSLKQPQVQNGATKSLKLAAQSKTPDPKRRWHHPTRSGISMLTDGTRLAGSFRLSFCANTFCPPAK